VMRHASIVIMRDDSCLFFSLAVRELDAAQVRINLIPNFKCFIRKKIKKMKYLCCNILYI